MIRILAIAASCVALGGCAVAARWDANEHYRESLANYRTCLAINAPQACEGTRLTMEADERAFNDMSGRGVNYSVQQR